jgi:UDP-N-acetylglucosamine kinase
MTLQAKTQQEAIEFIKKNKKKLVEHFILSEEYWPDPQPISIFMAGSPGAGKTEFSKRLLKENNINAIRIDADEIREFIPQYTGKNSDEIQAAASLGVNYIHDYVLKKNLNMILDGTFAYEEAQKNIERSLKRKRYVEIFFIYQAPTVAWRFAKAREKTEGRKVPKQVFVSSLFRAMNNVQKVKDKFGEQVKVHVIVKNYERDSENEYPDVQNIDRYVKIPYTQKELTSKL